MQEEISPILLLMHFISTTLLFLLAPSTQHQLHRHSSIMADQNIHPLSVCCCSSCNQQQLPRRYRILYFVLHFCYNSIRGSLRAIRASLLNEKCAQSSHYVFPARDTSKCSAPEAASDWHTAATTPDQPIRDSGFLPRVQIDDGLALHCTIIIIGQVPPSALCRLLININVVVVVPHGGPSSMLM